MTQRYFDLILAKNKKAPEANPSAFLDLDGFQITEWPSDQTDRDSSPWSKQPQNP